MNHSFTHTPETIEHMKNCEAREWLQRYKTKAGWVGHFDAKTWWFKNVMDIERIRGRVACDDLRARMNVERQKK